MKRDRDTSNRLTMPPTTLRRLLKSAKQRRFLVVGDVMLDQFIWGSVRRISPEAPVPVVEFQRESFMAGGAANVARNLTALGGEVELFGVVGCDPAAERLREELRRDGVGCGGLVEVADRPTGLKTRVIAHHQHVVRIDRERRGGLCERDSVKLGKRLREALAGADAVLVGDYAKGVVSQRFLDALRAECRRSGVWLSVDPKPVSALDLSGVSLLTPNRKEAFELVHREDETATESPLTDRALLDVADELLASLKPALLLVTLGGQGMLLRRRGDRPVHIPTVAQEVFDVSGAGDTVIAAFTLAVAAGASPLEAAVFSNHAAGVVVGKMGTATVTPAELLSSFRAETSAS